MRRPEVDDDIKAAVQGQDGEVLISWAMANITFNRLVPVAVDRPGLVSASVDRLKALDIPTCIAGACSIPPTASTQSAARTSPSTTTDSSVMGTV